MLVRNKSKKGYEYQYVEFFMQRLNALKARKTAVDLTLHNSVYRIKFFSEETSIARES